MVLSGSTRRQIRIGGVLGRQPERKTCEWSIHMVEPGGKSKWRVGRTGSGIVTSRATEGVKDGRASKMGVISGEAIYVCGRSCQRFGRREPSYQPRTHFSVARRLASQHQSRVRFSVRPWLFAACRVPVTVTRLSNSPIPATLPVTPPNVCPTAVPKARCRCLPGSL